MAAPQVRIHLGLLAVTLEVPDMPPVYIVLPQAKKGQLADALRRAAAELEKTR